MYLEPQHGISELFMVTGISRVHFNEIPVYIHPLVHVYICFILLFIQNVHAYVAVCN